MADYVRVLSDSPVILEEGPCPLPQAFAGISGFHHLPDDEVIQHGWMPYEREEQPTYDELTQELVPSLRIEDNKVVLGYAVTELADVVLKDRFQVAKAQRLQALAQTRWEREVGGFEWQGIPFHSDRESQTTLALAALGGHSRAWKDREDQWHDLTGEDLQQAAVAMEDHRQACFDLERELAERIQATESLEELDAVDIVGPWEEGR